MTNLNYLKEKPIAVLGGGASGRTQAADCSLAGREVRLFEFPEFMDSLSAVKRNSSITLTGPEINLYGFRRNGTAKISLITSDIKEAVAGAGIIIISLPAVAFDRLFELLVPCLEDGQIIHFMAGNFGSLLLRKKMRELDFKKKVVIGEWHSQPYGTRIAMCGNKQSTEVEVFYRAITLRGSALPSSDNGVFLESIKYIPSMDSVVHPVEADTVIDVGFSNANPVLHCPGTILGVGVMENWTSVLKKDSGTFCIYSHAFCPSISEVQYEFYREQAAITGAIGVGIQPYQKEDFFSRSNVLGPEFMGEGMVVPFEDNFPMLESTGPFTIYNRYITEDIPVGCCIQREFARKYGVEVPVIESMITLASVMTQNDFNSKHWDLSTLGIENLDKQQLLDYIRSGIYPA